jgi:PhnB protein
MKSFTPYLNFNRNTREAMTFYAEALDAKLDIMSFGEHARDPNDVDQVLHACITKDGQQIMASDPMPGSTVSFGDNVWINLECTSVEEQDRYWNALGAGGRVIMPLMNQFWGARFGMFADKFGVRWMLNCELPKT